LVAEELLSSAASAWDEANDLSAIHGVRNSQATVLAPTGTIGLMMDCDTTGIEPDLGLVKHKKLVGGGAMNIVNQTVPRALKVLGYTDTEVADIIEYIDVEKTILKAPHLKKEHEEVFACSMGDNAIHYLGHVKMMSAVQPFISGAISKTVNMPEDVTIEDVEQLHIDAWKLGLKAVAIYRDNCKVAQPLSMAKKEGKVEETLKTNEKTVDPIIVKGPVRREMPKTRTAKTFEFSVSGSKGFITVGEYEDGTPGEIFIKIAKQGSTLSGVMESLAISVSYGLQYGVPLKSYAHALTNMTFAPAGLTDDLEIRTATSLVDYIFKRLAHTYLSFDDLLELGLASIDDMPQEQTSLLTELKDNQTTASPEKPAPETPHEHLISDQPNKQEETVNTGAEGAGTGSSQSSAQSYSSDDNAPMCYNCGNQTQRSGSCYVCTSCGSTTGCS
jgi:ribonucleoside-diphosphate reductase alpha chain